MKRSIRVGSVFVCGEWRTMADVEALCREALAARASRSPPLPLPAPPKSPRATAADARAARVALGHRSGACVFCIAGEHRMCWRAVCACCHGAERLKVGACLCVCCGRSVPRERDSFAVPYCFACLAPPDPIGVTRDRITGAVSSLVYGGRGTR